MVACPNDLQYKIPIHRKKKQVNKKTHFINKTKHIEKWYFFKMLEQYVEVRKKQNKLLQHALPPLGNTERCSLYVILISNIFYYCKTYYVICTWNTSIKQC